VPALRRLTAIVLSAAALACSPPLSAQNVRVGQRAFGGWHDDEPGVWRKITPADLPPPYATRSAGNGPQVVPRPAGTELHVPPGFSVSLFADHLDRPRMIRTAPSGEIFVAESDAGRIRLLRSADGAPRAASETVFATGLDYPFGIAFWPPGPSPRFVYVAETNRVVRFPWHPGADRPDGPEETIIASLAPSSTGHATRDIRFTPDGRRLFVSVASGSNDQADMPAHPSATAVREHDARFGLGSGWGDETFRAAVLSFDPEGRRRQVFATGLRNCVSLAFAPGSSTPWCAVNERDGLGDNLPPDFVTSLREGGFYGWPWFYIGDHPDPAHAGERPDLAGRVITPDVLIQPHSAPLGMTFYAATSGAAAFPASYRGDIFVALHGSWNRKPRTGPKLVRIRPGDGAYEDFLTGFVVNDGAVWGRPVAVAVAHDGALLMTEDAGGTIWRIAPNADR
jgi:glucose/arabinose dehydrogenase